MKHDSLWKLLKDLLRGNAESRKQERVENAVKAHAKLRSEADYHSMMANYYNNRASNIDPHTDWWNFASVKQKEHDNVQDYLRYLERTEEAAARIEALAIAGRGHPVAGAEDQA